MTNAMRGIFVVLALAGSGCAEMTQCGAKTGSGACLMVDSIIPTYEGANTDSVDVVQNNCIMGTGMAATVFPEPFTDHGANVTVTNTQTDKGSVRAPAIVLQNFTIKYTVNGCPTGVSCPALDDLVVSPGQTVSIESGASATFTLPLMPIRKKQEFIDKGGKPQSFPGYTAQYIMTGPPDDPDAKETLVGYTGFTIGSYDYCPMSSIQAP